MPSVMSTLQEYVPAVGLFLLPYIGGTVFGGLITGGETRGRWFRSLKSPHLKPPDWIFPPVWTAIYACMGVSSYLVYREGGLAAQGLPLALYGSQLLLNWAWSPIFFYFHRIDLALVEILALWGSIVATTYVFHGVNSTAAYLLLPHLGWVSFASYLTFSYWRLNSGQNVD